MFCKIGIRRGWNRAMEYARRQEKWKCRRHGKAETWKAQESRKAECDRIVGRWMNGRVMERQTEGWTEGRKDGMHCTNVKDLASAYVLCPR